MPICDSGERRTIIVNFIVVQNSDFFAVMTFIIIPFNSIFEYVGFVVRSAMHVQFVSKTRHFFKYDSFINLFILLFPVFQFMLFRFFFFGNFGFCTEPVDKTIEKFPHLIASCMIVDCGFLSHRIDRDLLVPAFQMAHLS